MGIWDRNKSFNLLCLWWYEGTYGEKDATFLFFLYSLFSSLLDLFKPKWTNWNFAPSFRLFPHPCNSSQKVHLFIQWKKRPKQPLRLKAATKDRGAPREWRHDKHLINLSYSTVEKLELGNSPHKYGLMGRKHRFFLSNIFKDLMTMYSEINLYRKRGKTGGIYSIRLYKLYIFLWQQLTARLRSLLRVLIEPTRIDPMVYQRGKNDESMNPRVIILPSW